MIINESRIDTDIYYMRLIRQVIICISDFDLPKDLDDLNGETIHEIIEVFKSVSREKDFKDVAHYALVAKELTDHPEHNIKLINLLKEYQEFTLLNS